MKIKLQEQKNPWAKMILIIAILVFIGMFASGFLSAYLGESEKFGNVAIVPINGVIVPDGVSYFGQEVSTSSEIIWYLEDAAGDPTIEAIVLEINSPGGSPVASEEISNAVRSINKTVISWIRDIGTSGAYWVASSADIVIASRMSLTGAIGVISSYLQFSGLLKDYNITYERLVAGNYKDIGSPFKPLAFDERALFQAQLDEMHTYFIRAVAENRNLSEEKVRELATGMFFTGAKAKELGLVDILGGKEDAKKLLEQQLNTTVTFFEYEKEISILDILSNIFSRQSFQIGRGIGSSLTEGNNGKISVWT